MWQWMREQDTLVAVLLTVLAVALIMIIGAWPLIQEWWEMTAEERREHRAVRRARRRRAQGRRR